MSESMADLLHDGEQEPGTTTITLTNDEWAVIAGALVVMGLKAERKSYAVLASDIRERVTGHRIEGL